jgi:hypothetical protein
MRSRSLLACLPVLALGVISNCGSNLQPPHGATGGSPGTGGILGTGGVGATGATGPISDCAALSSAYKAALAQAQVCGNGGGAQCAVMAIADLPAAGCINNCNVVWVDDDSTLTAIRQQWSAANCQGMGSDIGTGPGTCPVLPCPAPPAGQCVVGDAGQARCQTTTGPSGTGGSGPVSCGTTICTSSEFCCDPLCSVCAPTGSLCTQGCKTGPDAGVTAMGTCASLAAQYQQAVAAAQSCTVGSGGCNALVHGSLAGSECGCDYIFVNDATQVNSIYQTWLSLGCQPKSLCECGCDGAYPSSGACVPTDGGAAGVCQIVFLI